MSSNFNVFFIFPHLLSTHAKKAADEEECQHVQVSQLNIHCWFITWPIKFLGKTDNSTEGISISH